MSFRRAQHCHAVSASQGRWAQIGAHDARNDDDRVALHVLILRSLVVNLRQIRSLEPSPDAARLEQGKDERRGYHGTEELRLP